MKRRHEFYEDCVAAVEMVHDSPRLSFDTLSKRFDEHTCYAIIEEFKAQKAVDPKSDLSGSYEVLDRMNWLYYTEYYRQLLLDEDERNLRLIHIESDLKLINRTKIIAWISTSIAGLSLIVSILSATVWK